MKTDLKIILDVNEMECIIKNVPYEIIDDEKCFDLDASIKCEMITQLMYEGKIPNVVDYDKVADIELDI